LHEIDAVLDELRAQEPTFKIERLAPDLADFPLDTPRGTKIARTARAACEMIRGETEFGAVGYGSDASKLSELAHIPSIVLGPGDIAQAHTADEWVEIYQGLRDEGFILRPSPFILCHAAYSQRSSRRQRSARF
jgi:acetylornithine deacetylase